MATLEEHMRRFVQEIADGGGLVVAEVKRKRDGVVVDVLCTIEKGADGKPLFFKPYAELITDTSEYAPIDGEVVNLGLLSDVEGSA